MSGRDCPDAPVGSAMAKALRERGRGPVAGERVAAAVAVVRAQLAVREARQLYIRTNFAGCISLLSITEQELGRNLTTPDAADLQRAHRLMARVNLWLGICQWGAGDPQTAAASFVRSSQLPSSPVPDSRLLPPELLQAYNKAVSAPREEVSCSLDPSLTADDLLVNGKGPTVKGRTLRVPAGTHYLVVKLPCPPNEARCHRRRRSMRLDGQPLGCKVPRPVALAAKVSPVAVCVGVREGADPSFVAEVAQLARARGMLVAALTKGGLTLRYGVTGRADTFVRQLVSSFGPVARVEGARGKVATVRRSIDLLLAGTRVDQKPDDPVTRTPWYGKWWVWGIAGATVAALVATTLAVATSGSDRVTVVFER